jgi:nicotinamide-nucleotide amidase
MEKLLPLAERVAARLKARGETVAVAESSTGGLISAALLALPGASAYFLGGGVIYTRQARQGFLGIADPLPGRMRPATEEYAALLARTARERTGANWGVGETGAAGPTGNRYGDPAGHSAMAVDGKVARAATLRIPMTVRVDNMVAFAWRALELLEEALGGG